MESAKKKKQLVQQDDPFEEVAPKRKFVPCAFGDQDLFGISENELDKECDEIFSEPIIDFNPRRENELDKAIAKMIKENNVTIPIVHIKGSLYLVGTSRVNLVLKREFVLVRTGGGYQKLYEFIPQNNRFFMRQLIVQMIKTGDGIETIVQKLIQGEKLPKQAESISPIRKSFNRNKSQVISVSPSRSNISVTTDNKRSMMPTSLKSNIHNKSRKSFKLDEHVRLQQEQRNVPKPSKAPIRTGSFINKSRISMFNDTSLQQQTDLTGNMTDMFNRISDLASSKVGQQIDT